MAEYVKGKGSIIKGHFCEKTYQSFCNELWEALEDNASADQSSCIFESFPWHQLPPEPIEILERLGDIIRECRENEILNAIESACMFDEETVSVVFSGASEVEKKQFARIAANKGVESFDLDELSRE